MKHNTRGITLGAFLAASIFNAGLAQAADPVTVVSWGGSYGAAQDAALFNDASKNSGIAINRESGASMSKTCLQVESGSVSMGPGRHRLGRFGFCCRQRLPGKD